MYSTTPLNRPPWDTGSMIMVVSWLGVWWWEPQPTLKKTQLHVVGENGGSQMWIFLQCVIYTKTFYKPSVLVFSMPTIN